MNEGEKLRMARVLRKEAEKVRRDGFGDFFEHTFTCLRYGQALKEREETRCAECPIRPYLSAVIQVEAFPCQHINEEGWDLIRQQPDLAEKFSAWLLRSAAQLEAEAEATYAKEKVI